MGRKGGNITRGRAGHEREGTSQEGRQGAKGRGSNVVRGRTWHESEGAIVSKLMYRVNDGFIKNRLK